MQANAPEIRNLNELRTYVHETLCELNDFEPGAFAITERLIVRSGEPCGIFFCMNGPRSVKVTAIWETDTSSVLFYGSTGERTQRTQLVGAPRLAAAAA
jgi:hypothetical protein